MAKDAYCVRVTVAASRCPPPPADARSVPRVAAGSGRPRPGEPVARRVRRRAGCARMRADLGGLVDQGQAGPEPGAVAGPRGPGRFLRACPRRSPVPASRGRAPSAIHLHEEPARWCADSDRPTPSRGRRTPPVAPRPATLPAAPRASPVSAPGSAATMTGRAAAAGSTGIGVMVAIGGEGPEGRGRGRCRHVFHAPVALICRWPGVATDTCSDRVTSQTCAGETPRDHLSGWRNGRRASLRC